ncbi:MerR family transcriptional regulator, redox-sensitive transcriptional activator SoxR [Bradyrhizobium brasilense]|uniref:MerR family transcriptional regulator, redox-sensitive transcriptional activator SoxR n=1 Tax=Bradyrhizobium brasilense TaxID=1419277 RepID=A0A1G6N7H4_9BRAD|nr:MerR family transcriptional regulator [Bradyrhizobium brasilense]SDC63790.1 MerR family transcriptional regulator, redox-sensitive transcriptional activator SoxR [Bradyrhizobium brasilense]
MELPNRSRMNLAGQYACPEWTWPADELIHIREMSERTSVPASALRYYEKLGLITSERETRESQRRYSKSTFYKIILITLAQSAGFNLDEIAEQLRNLPDIHPLPPKVWGPLHKIWERRIDQRVAELRQLKINLRRCTREASR